MKIRLLDTAYQDLMEGFEFYEKQEHNLGDYFVGHRLTQMFTDNGKKGNYVRRRLCRVSS